MDPDLFPKQERQGHNVICQVTHSFTLSHSRSPSLTLSHSHMHMRSSRTPLVTLCIYNDQQIDELFGNEEPLSHYPHICFKWPPRFLTVYENIFKKRPVTRHFLGIFGFPRYFPKTFP